MNKVPYWSENPLNILFNPISIKQLDPFEIDLCYLLTKLFQRMIEEDDINFRIGGLAVYSSSVILRIQSETLLNYVNSGSRKRIFDIDDELLELVFPKITQPLTATISTVSLEDLVITFKQDIGELVKRVRKERIVRKIRKDKKDFSELNVLFDERAIINMEDFINEIYLKIKTLFMNKNTKDVWFVDLLSDDPDELEVVRTFFAVLSLHFAGKIYLYQDDDLIIHIELVNGSE